MQHLYSNKNSLKHVHAKKWKHLTVMDWETCEPHLNYNNKQYKNLKIPNYE